MARAEGGGYVLLVRLAQPWRAEVGRLGTVEVPAGGAVYCGSALRGLRARICRHLRPEKTLRWHIDWLTTASRPVGAIAIPSRINIECRLRRSLRRRGWRDGPPGFGASDCTCPTHLLLGGDNHGLEDILAGLPARWRERARIIGTSG
ncbi:MAG: DUF123 domain-containing protein [Armatimonadia bacterium]|nr:DUF123 domain-containing protein [Armatimonadia bacterium]